MPPRVHATATGGLATEYLHHEFISNLEVAHSVSSSDSLCGGDASGVVAAYATLWARRLETKDLVRLVDSYRTVVFKPVSTAIADQILGLLNLHSSDSGLQPQASAFLARPMLPLAGDFYNVRRGREKLQRLLLTLAKGHKNLGINFAFARFCAILLEVMKNEKPCFTLASQLYIRLWLDDYYLKPCEAMQKDVSPKEFDVARVLEELGKMWPASVEAIKRSRLHDRLTTLIGSWLETLLAAGYDPTQQPLENFLPLLDRVVFPLQTFGANGSEARRRLKYIIVCVCGRHLALVASNAAALEKQLKKLECYIPVDQLLLEMIDQQIMAKPGHAKFIFSLRPSAGALHRPPQNPCFISWLGKHCSNTFRSPACPTCPPLSQLRHSN